MKFAHFKDTDVFDAESEQIAKRTSLVIVICTAPSWGGGAEIALAAQCKIPVLFLVPRGKKISRYITSLTKSKGVFADMIEFFNQADAISKLKEYLSVGSFVPTESELTGRYHP